MFEFMHQEAPQQGDQELATRLAHTIKGVAGTIGAEALQAVAGELEAALKAGLNTTPPELFDQLDAALKPVLETLAPVATATESASTAAARPAGNADQLAEWLAELAPLLDKKKPKPCKEIITELTALAWPENVAQRIDELDRLIGKYKFKDAQAIVEALNHAG